MGIRPLSLSLSLSRKEWIKVLESGSVIWKVWMKFTNRSEANGVRIRGRLKREWRGSVGEFVGEV